MARRKIDGYVCDGCEHYDPINGCWAGHTTFCYDNPEDGEDYEIE